MMIQRKPIHLTRAVAERLDEGAHTTNELKALFEPLGFDASKVRRALGGARRNGWVRCVSTCGSHDALWERTDAPLTLVGRPKGYDVLNEQADWRQQARLADDAFARLIGVQRYEDVRFVSTRRR